VNRQIQILEIVEAKMMRKLVGAIALSASMATPAVAQDNPLVGDWFSTFMDPRGVTNTLYHAHFGGDGRLTMEAAVSGSGGSGRMVSMNSYQMTGPASYQGTVIDYEPKGMPPFLGAPGTKCHRDGRALRHQRSASLYAAILTFPPAPLSIAKT
jgi:hypothetical protein